MAGLVRVGLPDERRVWAQRSEESPGTRKTRLAG